MIARRHLKKTELMKLQKFIYTLAVVFSACFLLVACDDDDVVNVEPAFGFVLSDTDTALESIEVLGSAGERMVQIVSNVDWSVTSDADWLKLSNTSGVPTINNATTMYLKLSYDKYLAADSRTATITLAAAGLTKTLRVTQVGLQGTDAEGHELAATAVANMKMGVCIGNTLDANGTWFAGTNPSDYETCWGNPVITKDLIHAFSAAGFKAVRLPVTWWQNIDQAGHVRDIWMARVEEVVGWILDEGMYCVLDVHHDTGGADSCWLRADAANIDAIESRFTTLWTEIATRFIGYGDKLVFEGYNEMLDGHLRWSETDDAGYAAHSRLAQAFVNTVRATGGNNASRNLLVNTYSANPGERTTANFSIPTDVAANHLIIGVHVYAPGSFTSPAEGQQPAWESAHESELTEIFNRLSATFINKGLPVVVGEFGAQSGDEAEIAKYASFFSEQCSRRGMAGFYWFDLINRHDYSWTLPLVKDALVK